VIDDIASRRTRQTSVLLERARSGLRVDGRHLRLARTLTDRDLSDQLSPGREGLKFDDRA
jgi:hypothetical protein